MKISVIIPTYNNLELLKAAIASLEKQSLPYSEFEVIIIDDCSSDGTADFLRNYDKPMNILPIFNVENLGRGKTRNKGIFQAANELIVFLDSDREVEPDFLALHMEAQKNGPQVSIGRMFYHQDIPMTKINRYLEKRGAFAQPPDKNLPGRYFVSCNSSVPTSVLKETGGFDENITHYGGEDLELGHRLAKLLPIRSLPGAIDYHHHYRGFEDFFRIVYGYGRHSLPYIIKKHPELHRELGLDNHPPKSIRDFCIAYLCLKPMYNVIKLISKLDIVPDIFISYLIFRNYRAGYRHGIKPNKV